MVICTPGMGADTCIWLIVGADGFECCYLNKPAALYERHRKGKTVAKRDGCSFVNNIDPAELDLGEQFIEVPGVTKKK